MSRLLLDEMLGPQTAAAVNAAGGDALCVVEVPGLAGTTDEAVLRFAAADQRSVVTRDVVDYVALDRSWRERGLRHHGLVLLTENGFPQRKDRIGSVVRALLVAELPAPTEVAYLRPVTPR